MWVWISWKASGANVMEEALTNPNRMDNSCKINDQFLKKSSWLVELHESDPGQLRQWLPKSLQ